MATTKSSTPVILLVRNAAKDDFGGAETYTVSIAEILIKNGFHPVVVSRSKKVLDYARSHSVSTYRGWWWSRQNWSGRRVLLMPFYVLWQLVLTLWYLQLIARTHAQALHLQSKDDFIAGTLAGWLTRRQVIWTDHMDLRYVFQNISRPLRNPVGKLVFHSGKLANHIILISENEHKLVTSHFKNKNDLKDQIILIKNGVVDQQSKYPYKQHKTFSFCIASRIVTNKGIGEAIQAYVLLKEQRALQTPTKLDIYGDGQGIKKFKALAAGHNDIVFHGHQANAIAKIAESDVFILPSYQEGLSITLLEATMLGKAIIATAVDSNPEVIRDKSTGLLVQPRDVKDLANAMSQIYSDSALRHKLEKNARSNYEHSFNLETSVKERIIPLYYPGS